MQPDLLPDLVRDCTEEGIDKVDRVIGEIKDSERRFGNVLQQIIQNLLTPCHPRKDLFTCDDVTAIFCNLETLSTVQVQFCDELSTISDISMLTSCFCHWLPILAPLYDKYCANFSNAIKRLQAKDKKTVNYNKSFERRENGRTRKIRNRISNSDSDTSSDGSISIEETKSTNSIVTPSVASISINWLELCNSKQALFLEGCRVKSKMPNLPVGAFLLEPVQRITRYPLLLKTLWTELIKVVDYDEKIFDLQQLQIIISLSEHVAAVANSPEQRKKWISAPIRSSYAKPEDTAKKLRAFNIVRSIFVRN